MEKSFAERVAEAKAEVSALTPHEANDTITSNPDALVIDPRNEADIQSTTGIIPGALNVPLSKLNESADGDLPEELASRSRPVITACQAD